MQRRTVHFICFAVMTLMLPERASAESNDAMADASFDLATLTPRLSLAIPSEPAPENSVPDEAEKSTQGPVGIDVATADASEGPQPERFRMPADIKKLEIAFQVLGATDAALTVYCLEKGTCREGNPIFGKQPGAALVIGSRVAGGAAHYFLAREASKHHPGITRIGVIGSIILMTAVLGHNLTVVF